MINRGKMPRQLRRSGGITNAVPRTNYFLGGIKRRIRKLIPNELASIAVKAAPFVAPFNPAVAAAMAGIGGFDRTGRIGSSLKSAALTYGGGQVARQLGGADLQGNPFTEGGAFRGGLEGLKSGFSSPLGSTNMAKLFGSEQADRLDGAKGLFEKLKLTEGAGSLKLTGLGKISAGALASYFVAKGATPEEAKDLTKDVYRGKGIGFDQIRADLNKYRSGDLNPQQMFDKNYRFLTPRKFIAAEGGSPNMKMAEIPKGLTMEKAVRTFELSNGRKPKNMQEVIEFFKNRKLSAEGGTAKKRTLGDILEHGYFMRDERLAGPDDGSYDIGNIIERFSKGIKLPEKISDKDRGDVKTKKDIFERDTPLTEDLFGLSEGFTLSPITLFRRFLAEKELEKKSKKAEGGIMSMPTGKMRKNSAGIMERDYRDEGGFVPVGVKEKADDVPAMLSKNEFVMTADAVRGAGNGSIDKGAQKMYNTMKRLEGMVK